MGDGKSARGPMPRGGKLYKRCKIMASLERDESRTEIRGAKAR